MVVRVQGNGGCGEVFVMMLVDVIPWNNVLETGRQLSSLTPLSVRLGKNSGISMFCGVHDTAKTRAVFDMHGKTKNKNGEGSITQDDTRNFLAAAFKVCRSIYFKYCWVFQWLGWVG